MTNGKMEESIQKQALLSDVEPESFGQLLEFAYKGLCGLAETTNHPVALTTADLSLEYRCHWCSANTVVRPLNGSYYPFCCEEETYSYHGVFGRTKSKSTVYCVVSGCDKFWRLGLGAPDQILCFEHNTFALRRKHPSFADVANGHLRLVSSDAKSFQNRTYGCGGLSHEHLSQQLERHKDTNTPRRPSTLISHAKLYVLANRYLVQDLQDISLHKLHRHLSAFEVADSSIDEIIDLVLYTYSNTSDDGDIAKGTADKLRDLVMGFVAWQAKNLCKCKSFRSMLGAGGPQTEDYIALVHPEMTE